MSTCPTCGGEIPIYDPGNPQFSPRQRQVLELLVEGHGDKMIAQQLNLSVSTVKAHTGLLYAKLGVRCRIRAAVVGSALLGREVTE